MVSYHLRNINVFGNSLTSVSKIKAWHDIGQAETDYLGMQWIRGENFIRVDMNMYVDKVEFVQIDPEQPPDRLLEEPLRKMYKSAHAKLRWPVCHVLPEKAYETSYLSQRSREKLTYGDAYLLNDIIEDVKGLSLIHISEPTRPY